ncbi:MAG: C1 family peptidase [Candidatus Lernaella stagnicola]|nr:C1 family peptidase [Candidatus Lernaella stagnicola]
MRRLKWIIALAAILALATTAVAQDITVEEIQTAIEAKGGQWSAAYTDAWEKHHDYGWYPANLTLPELTGNERYFRPLGLDDYPAHLDWRDFEGENWVTRVKNQMSCGSCWSFATIGPIEAHIQIQEDWPEMGVNLSEQHLISCCTGVGCHGCNGGFTTTSYDFAETIGLVDEDCFAYKANDTVPCDDKCSDWNDRVYKIDNWAIIGEGALDAVLPDPEDVIEGLMFGPLGTSLAIYQDFYSYESGIYDHMLGIPTGFHAVTIVGYDVEEGYWICKNSWGSSFGEDGYFRIKWGAAFVGAFTILPEYTAQGLKPPESDDDEADDDTGDDDTGDDDDDDDDNDTAGAAPDQGDDDDDNDSGGCS